VILRAAEALDELKVPPGNKLEVLKHDRIGQPLDCFNWNDREIEYVEICDYH
jgi:proteic killer suppression protein